MGQVYQATDTKLNRQVALQKSNGHRACRRGSRAAVCSRVQGKGKETVGGWGVDSMVCATGCASREDTEHPAEDLGPRRCLQGEV